MDAFISYRRDTGGMYAREIYDFLREEAGMDVFYDIESMREYTGRFPEHLKRNILSAENFILVITDLNIADYEKSVFIQEITTALQENKNIIVVIGSGFKFPEILHFSIKEISQYEAIDATNPQYFKGEFRIALLGKMSKSPKRDAVLRRLRSCSKLESRLIIENRLSLSERLSEDVIAVDMCAFACQGFLSHARENLERLLNRGCNIRVLMNNPHSRAAKEAYQNKIMGGNERHRSRIIAQSYADMLDWKKSYPEHFQGRTTKAFLPCAIFIIRKTDPQNDTIKVDYYSFGVNDAERRSVLISSDDEENFNFYIRQFELLWNYGK